MDIFHLAQELVKVLPTPLKSFQLLLERTGKLELPNPLSANRRILLPVVVNNVTQVLKFLKFVLGFSRATPQLRP